MLHRCRTAGYRLVAAAVTVAAGLTLLGAPAGAEPGQIDPKAELPTEGRSAENCSTSFFGVSAANRITSRALEDGRVVSTSVVSRRLPFAVTSMGYGESTGDDQGPYYEIVSLSADKRLRVIKVRDGIDAPARWTAQPLANREFRHRLLTGSPGSFFAVDAKGVLRRWHMLRNDRGQRYLGAGKVVRRGLGGLKTLTNYGTFPLAGGHHTAILFGTTRTGALVQIRVIDRNPDRTDEPVGAVRLVWLRKSGFGKYDTATVGNCNLNYNQAAVTFVDRDGDRAHLYKLTRAITEPTGRRLVDIGEVGPNAHWQFRAAF